MNERIVIYKSKKKSVIIIFTGLLLMVIGWLFFRYTNNNITGWSFTILAGLCVIFGIGSWFDKKAYIILTEKGITEMSGIREEIEWNAIRKADEFYYWGQYFIRLLLDRSYKSGLLQPTWFYRFDRFYAQKNMRAIFLRIGFLEVNAIKLTHFINKMVQADAENRIILLKNFRLTLQKSL